VGQIPGNAPGRGCGERTAAAQAGADYSPENESERQAAMKIWLAALLAGLASLPGMAADKLTLGFMSTLSGPAAVIGNDIRDGMRLGLEHVENRVGGLPTTVLVEDDRQKVEVAVELANRFVRQDKVDAIIGLSFSNLLLAIYPTVVDAQTVLISSNPGPSQIAGKDCSKYFFSTSWQGDNWSEAMGAYLQKAGVQNVYVMAPNYAAGRDVVNGFKRFYKGKLAGEVYTGLSQLDFQAELAQLRAAKPSAWESTSSSNTRRRDSGTRFHSIPRTPSTTPRCPPSARTLSAF
jgi:branched-chain amino acid transport system substrate-binding protein